MRKLLATLFWKRNNWKNFKQNSRQFDVWKALLFILKLCFPNRKKHLFPHFTLHIPTSSSLKPVGMNFGSLSSGSFGFWPRTISTAGSSQEAYCFTNRVIRRIWKAIARNTCSLTFKNCSRQSLHIILHSFTINSNWESKPYSEKVTVTKHLIFTLKKLLERTRESHAPYASYASSSSTSRKRLIRLS